MEWAFAIVVSAVILYAVWTVKEDIRKAREAELRRDQRYKEAMERHVKESVKAAYDIRGGD